MNNITNKYEEIADFMKNFSNKDKLAILCFLWEEEKNVSTIMQCSNISQSQVSQYLSKMKLEKLLKSEKKWKEVFYSIADKKILQIIKSMKDIFNN